MEGHEHGVGLDLVPRELVLGPYTMNPPTRLGEADLPSTCESPLGFALKLTIEEPARAGTGTQASHLLNA